MRGERIIIFLLSLLVPLAYCYKIDNPFTPTKWIVFYFLTIISSLFLFKTIKIPKLPKKIWLPLVGIITSGLISVLSNFQGSYLTHYLDWILFGLLVLLSFNMEREELWKSFYLGNLLSSFLVILFATLQLLDIQIPYLPHISLMDSTFGNVNMAGEFIGVSLLIQLFFLQRSWTHISIRLFLLISNIAYLFVLMPRAVILGLLSVSTFYLITNKIKISKKWLASAGVLILILFSSAQLFNKKTKGLFEGTSVEIRLNRWANTIGMIYENPLGIGPGNYEYAYITYDDYFKTDTESNKNYVVKSPHNGFLELGSEFGIIAFVFIVPFLFFLFPRKFTLESSLFIYIFIVALWNFPLENTYPFMVSAIFLGQIFKSYPHRKIDFKIPMVVILPYCLWISTKFMLSEYWEMNGKTYDEQKLSCHYLDTNLKGCFFKGIHEIRMGRVGDAKATFHSILDKKPNHFPSLINLSLIYANQRNMKFACKYLYQYRKLSNNFEYDQKLPYKEYCKDL